MYTEELEGFEEEAENTPRTYVSAATPQDAEKLARENERLKKNLEKEKFFNKLLDQELKDVKAEAATRVPADFVPVNRGVSKGAFYTVLILALALAGYLAYSFYNNGQLNTSSIVTAPADTEEKNSTEQPVNGTTSSDTVPEIIANAPATNTKPAEAVKKTVAPPINNNIITEEENAEPIVQEKPVSTNEAAAKVAKRDVPAPDKTTPPAADAKENIPAATENITPPAQPSRPVIATYKVTSKANFYNSADENTLRSSFINCGNKTVNALEDKNGFIYVEYTNENGMVNRGWLSKKDLTQE